MKSKIKKFSQFKILDLSWNIRKHSQIINMYKKITRDDFKTGLYHYNILELVHSLFPIVF